MTMKDLDNWIKVLFESCEVNVTNALTVKVMLKQNSFIYMRSTREVIIYYVGGRLFIVLYVA